MVDGCAGGKVCREIDFSPSCYIAKKVSTEKQRPRVLFGLFIVHSFCRPIIGPKAGGGQAFFVEQVGFGYVGPGESDGYGFIYLRTLHNYCVTVDLCLCGHEFSIRTCYGKVCERPIFCDKT